MGKYKFSNSERFAVYVTHLEKCYLCTLPVDLRSMQVDHVIPESLLADPKLLEQVKNSLALPASFNINSYSNWMPSCVTCNRKKSSMVFNPSPIIQAVLQKAESKAKQAQGMANQVVSKQKTERALNQLLRANESGELTSKQKNQLEPLLDYQEEVRPFEMRKAELNITPRYRISRPSPARRAELIQMYGGKCQMCSVTDDSIIQMCSIRSFNAGGGNLKDNLLLLCPNHHQLFDRGKVSVNEDMTLNGLSGNLTVVSDHNISLESINWHKLHVASV